MQYMPPWQGVVWGRQSQVLASQPGSQFIEKLCSKAIKWRRMNEISQRPAQLSTSMCTHKHGYHLAFDKKLKLPINTFFPVYYMKKNIPYSVLYVLTEATKQSHILPDDGWSMSATVGCRIRNKLGVKEIHMLLSEGAH